MITEQTTIDGPESESTLMFSPPSANAVFGVAGVC